MNELFTKITTWIKANILLSVVIFVALVSIIFPKQLRKVFSGGRKRVKHRPGWSETHDRKGRLLKPTKSGRQIPRSAGKRKSSTGKGYPAAGGGYIPFKYNKDGTVKKAWQVGGTVAAKNRMARLRRNR
jgi:hypothetical protein